MRSALLLRLALCAVLASLIVIVAPTHASIHAQEATPVPQPVAQVEMIGGQTLRLEGPLSVTGAWQIGELSLSSFKLDYLQNIERLDSGAFLLTLTDGTQVEGVPGAGVTLEGEGEWGRESLQFSAIQRISLEGASPLPEPVSVDSSARIETTGGLIFRLTEFSLSGEWLIGGLRIERPDYAYIETLERSGDWTFTAQAADGESIEMRLDEWAASTFAGNTAWGYATLPCLAIQRFVIEKAPLDTFSPAVPADSPQVQIETSDGQVVTLTGVSLNGRAQVAASEVESILFELLRCIERTGDQAFLVEDTAGATLDLTVEADTMLQGKHQWGRASLPFTAVQRVTVSGAGAWLPATVATLELTDGSTWTIEPQMLYVAQPLSRSGQRGREWDMLLLAPPVEFWIRDSYWTRYGFSQQDSQFAIPCGVEPCPAGYVDDPEAYLEFTLSALLLRVPLSDVQRFTPATEAQVAPLQPRWSVTVTDWDGHSLTFPFTQLAYTRYPDTCWSGWYSHHPFRWYTDTLLPVIKADGSRLDIDFERLARIEWPARYDSQRRATVVSTQGSSLAVTIYPGSTNEDTKSGPASWDSSLEGLVGTVADGYQVYIPLQNVSLIELNPPTGG